MSEWYLQAQGRTFPRGKSDYFLKKRGHSESLCRSDQQARRTQPDEAAITARHLGMQIDISDNHCGSPSALRPEPRLEESKVLGFIGELEPTD